MYRYGDGTPFPLEENFIETLTTAVETCTNAFVPLSDLDARRERARDGRREAEREIGRLEELEQAMAGTLVPYMTADKKPAATATVAQKLAQLCKSEIAAAKNQVDSRVRTMEAHAAPRTAVDDMLRALRPFFDEHQLPKTQWIMSWDVRGNEPHADAVATAGRIVASFQLDPEPYRGPIRVEQLSDGVIVHMLRKGVFGKAKPAPVDLGKYVLVAFEKTARDTVVTLKENPHKASPGLRFAVSDGGATDGGATWVSISPSGDAEGEVNPLDLDDVAPIRQLAERTTAAFKNLVNKRSLVDLTFGGKQLTDLEEPRIVALELLQQLTPLARSIREKSRMSGELILKRDIGDGRREELFVPRATLAQQFARLPAEYRRPFEEMGITNEETQPAIMLPPRPPARRDATAMGEGDSTVEVDPDLD
ncbi:MAG: hypothetical protein H0T89_27010 [Deltaproteobacteria bacterium]|nr:hypothetical protein [Deltaproteobacteria bacterium]MDQ3298627.1 hypothetical protein [Myxococcota bacterium]